MPKGQEIQGGNIPRIDIITAGEEIVPKIGYRL